MTVVGILAHILLIPLPGAWVAFGPAAKEAGFWERLLVSIALSPFLVALEFYALRFAGLSFEACAIAIPIVNLPAAWLVLRAARERERVGIQAVLAWSGVALFVLAYLLLPRLVDPEGSRTLAHAWMHSDTVYMLAGGWLAPEETLLAGARQAYPWFGHVLPALLGYLADSPPFESYAWSNMIWAVATAALCGAVTRRLGGGVASQVVAGLAYLFALNGLGYFLVTSLPTDLTAAFPIFGDWRYTPVIWKYRFFNQVPYSMALFGVLIWALLFRSGRGPSLLIALCAAGIGTIYPILLPAAAAAVAARLIASRIAREEMPMARGLRQWGLPAFAGAALAFAYVQFFVTVDREAGVGMLASFPRMASKAAELPVVTALFLVGVVAVFRRSSNELRTLPGFLVLGALACAAIYVPFEIPHWRMEYKLMFPIAFCLAPFAGLGLEPVLSRAGRAWLPIVCLLAFVVSTPMLHKVVSGSNGPVVPVDASRFVAELAPGEPLAELSQAVRERTPADTVVLVEHANMHLPTILHRSLWIAPDSEDLFPGFNMRLGAFLQLIRGYDRAIVSERIAVRARLLGDDDTLREPALSAVMELGRPVALVLESDRHTAALAWLRSRGVGSVIHDADGLVVWLVEPR